MNLKEYIEQLKQDLERLENQNNWPFQDLILVNSAEQRVVRNIIEDLKNIKEAD